ncbi:hypothetical protein [Bathymodiolus japonicus methanotrophic gill symbiont]|uniref:hypothetical protein n=1 Tax=Bathymodiolus japonicus methanotrophic gill symbiont TaxID=113269 RepID=UPI001C8EF6D5|nr:hypothetical protein [Bathymodiolus japonicus methanotrophic gill symbiont]
MAFYFVSTFANAQTPTKQRPYGYRGLKIITSLRLRFPDFQRLLEFITSLLEFPDPGDKLKELGELIKDVFQLMPSGKHMIGRDLGRLGPTASLKYCSAG